MKSETCTNAALAVVDDYIKRNDFDGLKTYTNSLVFGSEAHKKATDEILQNALSLIGRGAAKYQLGRHQEAIDDFDAALRLEPNNAFALRIRGTAKCRLGRHQEAIDDFDNLLKADPRNTVLLHLRANVQILLKNLKGAFSDMALTFPRECSERPTIIPYERLDFTHSPELGKGSYGAVVRALWQEQPVAVKKLTDSKGVDWLKEAMIQSRLQHDNVVRCYGLSYSSTEHMLVMELMSCSLHQLLKKEHTLSWKVRLDIALDVIKALIYLGDQLIVHGDLKPSNIMIDSHNRAKITDFGLSEELLSAEAQTRVSLGTPSYQAPEMLSRQSNTTQKTDVYALGIILWQICTSQNPYPSMSEDDVKRSVQAGKRPDIPTNMPRYLADFIIKCWNHEPQLRPDTNGLRQQLSFFSTVQPDLNTQAATCSY